MVISHARRFIMIHVPRSAGTSMAATLRSVESGSPASPLDENILPWELSYPHFTAQEIRKYLGTDLFGSYFKFSFVRDPWDRLVSRYFNLRAQQNNDADARINTRNYYPPGPLSFEEWLLGEGPKRNCIHPLDMRQQIDYLADENGDLIVNFVGRFETLSQDFEKACRRIGVALTLPHENHQSPSKNFRSHYTSDRAIKFVKENFRDDIRLWGYEY